MSVENGVQNHDQITYQIVLRKPETILRKLYGKDLEILKYERRELSGKGENYGSTIFKVKFVVKRSADSKSEEEINVIAKMYPPTEVQRQLFQSPYTFKKEIFFYEKIMPTYRDICREIDEKFDIAPELFGSRLSLRSDDTDEVDEDAVILLEDLKYTNYYMGNRWEGLDLAHLKSAVTSMAKFHAVGLSVKHKRPEFLKKYESYNRTLDVEPTSLIENLRIPCLRYFEETKELQPYVRQFENLLDSYIANAVSWLDCDPFSTWSCVIHNDLWLNNMMFHKDDENVVNHVKLVDFQTYCLDSPLRDLMFFLTTSSEVDVLLNDFDELIELYRTIVEDILNRLGCDTEFITKENFLKKLKEDAEKELAHCMVMLKPITLLEGEDFTLEETDNQTMTINEFFKKKLRSVILLYAQKIWA